MGSAFDMMTKKQWPVPGTKDDRYTAKDATRGDTCGMVKKLGVCASCSKSRCSPTGCVVKSTSCKSGYEQCQRGPSETRTPRKFEAKFKNYRYPARSRCFPGWSLSDMMKYEISTRGAITAALDTKAGFSRGNGKMVTKCNKKAGRITHAVVQVGYGVAKGASGKEEARPLSPRDRSPQHNTRARLPCRAALAQHWNTTVPEARQEAASQKQPRPADTPLAATAPARVEAPPLAT